MPSPTSKQASRPTAGDAMNPEGEAPEEDKDDAEGPVHTRPRCPVSYGRTRAIPDS